MEEFDVLLTDISRVNIEITHRDIPRPAGCGISPLKFEMAP